MENKEAAATKSQVRDGPKVSVCVITYNQVEYIQRCLDSILNQDVDFPIEVLVADDCSTDGTREVILDYSIKFPKLIKPILNEANVGGTRNFIQVHRAATAQYVAHMDGDDFWLQGKLSYQVSMLDRNSECNFIADYIGKRKIDNGDELRLTANELFAENNPVLHSSKLYRRSAHRDVPDDRGAYLDFESNLRHLAEGGVCILTRRRTTSHTITSSSVRARINDSTIDGFINTIIYAKQTGVGLGVIILIFNNYIKSCLSLAIATMDLSGVKKIKNAISLAQIEILPATRFRLFLASNIHLMRLTRSLLLMKRVLHQWGGR